MMEPNGIDVDGFAVMVENPFFIVWFDEEKKRAFYQQHFTEQEFVIYEILSAFSSSDDITFHYELEGWNIFIDYQPATHDILMQLMEESDEPCYRSIRLLIVTVGFLTHDHHYLDEVKNAIYEFLDSRYLALRKKANDLIQQHLKPMYEQTLLNR